MTSYTETRELFSVQSVSRCNNLGKMEGAEGTPICGSLKIERIKCGHGSCWAQTALVRPSINHKLQIPPLVTEGT
jgi:uncharacterized low-complexity protein